MPLLGKTSAKGKNTFFYHGEPQLLVKKGFLYYGENQMTTKMYSFVVKNLS